jgi:RND family efflux transporter MFP subunit
MKQARFLSIGTAAVLFTGCHKTPEPVVPGDLPAAAVGVQTVEPKPRVASEEVVGTVQAKLRSVVEGKVSGKLEQMVVVPGQQVQAGEVLAVIDAREVRARLDQALAVRQQAEGDLKRYTSLLEQKILSPAEYDAAQSRFRVAEAAVKEAETMLGYTRVSAPFAGVITRKHADVGDLAVPGKALLEMEDSRALRLEADVPEAVVGKLALGDKLPVRITAIEKQLEGVVSEIAPAADPGSRTFLVKLDLPATPGLRAGQFGRVAVPVGETTALRVALSAVAQRGQMEVLFVAHDGRAEMRLVKTGKRIGDEVEVVSGITAGEKIVVEGAAALVEGQPLSVKP